MEREHTLLYTDLVGSTEVNTRLGDGGMAPLWDRHDRGFRDLLRQWRGREIDRSDGFAVLFEATTDAAHFALAYHRMLAGLPVPLQARAGLHVGPVTLRQNTEADVALGAKPFEVIGIARAFSARLMTLAQGGQTLVSAQAAAALDGGPWRCQHHGHWRMRGVDEPQPVFEIGDDGHAPFTPPPDSEKSQRVVQRDGQWVGVSDVPRNLPTERDPFFGRGDDLRALSRLFHDGARLVTLHGAGGIGKTRLALRYGWAWLGEFPGGVWFCDLAPARGLDGLLHAVAQGLDVPLGKQPQQQLGHAIAGHGRCLLVLDNFEHLVRHAGDTLERWLDAAPDLRCIVTSRALLGLRGERALALDPLPARDAVALFHARAQAALSSYDAGRVDAAQVQQLVTLLDGLPLAVELAAARVGVLPPHELLARMGDRFRLLASRGGRPDRQATLQATLAWSWDTLGAAERSALAQLSVFASGFTMAAAQAVADIAGCDDGAWIFDVVQSLVDKSLLRPQADGRFTLLRSVQDYAAQQLQAEGRFPGSGPALLQAARQRHHRHYATLDEAAASAQHCIELDNLVTACRRATTAGDAADASACLRLSWAALRMTGPFRVALELADAVRVLPLLTPRLAAAVEWVAAAALFTTGMYEAAQAAALRGIALQGDGGEAVVAARLRCVLGESCAAVGDAAAATEHLGAARLLAERCDDTATRCQVLNAIGALASEQGRLDDARAAYESALAVAVAAGDKRWQGGLLGNLGLLHYAEGQLGQARQSYEHALELAHAVGDRRWEANARCNLGLIQHEHGHGAAAEVELGRALEMARDMGHRHLENTVRCNLGIVLQAGGRQQRAIEHYAAAVAGAEACTDPRTEGLFRSYLGAALAQVGRFDDARACLHRGRELLLQANDPMNLGLLLCSVAECERLSGQDDAARLAWQEAQSIGRTQQAGPASELGRRLVQVAPTGDAPDTPQSRLMINGS